MFVRLCVGLTLAQFIFLAINASTVQGSSSIENTFIRDRRSSEVCKYTKGEWSECNPLTKLEAREDKVRVGPSAPDCPPTRTITRNCNKDKSIKPNSLKKGLCVYAKARDQEWSDCKSGVRQKLLKLLSEKPNAGCPNMKIISKKCKNKKNKKEEKKKGEKKSKNEKKRERKEKKEAKLKKKQEKMENKISEKCNFGSWSEYTACTDHKQSRTRQITRGEDVKLCRKQATQIQKC